MFSNVLIMQLILILEEYSPKLIYIQGSKDTLSDTLSILDIVNTPNPDKNNIKSEMNITG